MSDITITESRYKKEELRRTIAELLLKFSNETGLFVNSIDVERDERYVGDTVLRYRVAVEVKLP